MNKMFTLQEAQTLLPVLGALLKRAQELALRSTELELEMQQLSQRIFLSGGMHVNVVAAARRRGERDKARAASQEHAGRDRRNWCDRAGPGGRPAGLSLST